MLSFCAASKTDNNSIGIVTYAPKMYLNIPSTGESNETAANSTIGVREKIYHQLLSNKLPKAHKINQIMKPEEVTNISPGKENNMFTQLNVEFVVLNQ